MPVEQSLEEVQKGRRLLDPLSPHSDSTEWEFDESQIGLGKHPHGGRVWTKGAILFPLVEANVLRFVESRLGLRVPSLTTDSKT